MYVHFSYVKSVIEGLPFISKILSLELAVSYYTVKQ